MIINCGCYGVVEQPGGQVDRWRRWSWLYNHGGAGSDGGEVVVVVMAAMAVMVVHPRGVVGEGLGSW